MKHAMAVDESVLHSWGLRACGAKVLLMHLEKLLHPMSMQRNLFKLAYAYPRRHTR